MGRRVAILKYENTSNRELMGEIRFWENVKNVKNIKMAENPKNATWELPATIIFLFATLILVSSTLHLTTKVVSRYKRFKRLNKASN